jgi:hypothetical protein
MEMAGSHIISCTIVPCLSVLMAKWSTTCPTNDLALATSNPTMIVTGQKEKKALFYPSRVSNLFRVQINQTSNMSNMKRKKEDDTNCVQPKEKKRYKSVAAKHGSMREAQKYRQHIERTSVIHDMSRCIAASGKA